MNQITVDKKNQCESLVNKRWVAWMFKGTC